MKMLALLLMLAPLAFAEPWEFFREGAILRTSCKAQLITFNVAGNAQGRSAWIPTASAERQDPDPMLRNWSHELGQYEPTIKGRHKAERACSKWMDEAAKYLKPIAKEKQ